MAGYGSRWNAERCYQDSRIQIKRSFFHDWSIPSLVVVPVDKSGSYCPLVAKTGEKANDLRQCRESVTFIETVINDVNVFT